jgi:hypothetical protein
MNTRRVREQSLTFRAATSISTPAVRVTKCARNPGPALSTRLQKRELAQSGNETASEQGLPRFGNTGTRGRRTVPCIRFLSER